MKRYGPSPLYIIPSVVIGAVVLFLTVAFFFKGKIWGVGFALFFALPLFFILLFVNYRFIYLSDSEICVKGLLGKRCFSWDQVELIEVRKLGIRNVLWIQCTDGVSIVPLVFGDLEGIYKSLKEIVPEKVKDGWKRSQMDILLLYMTAAFLLFTTLSKFLLR